MARPGKLGAPLPTPTDAFQIFRTNLLAICKQHPGHCLMLEFCPLSHLQPESESSAPGKDDAVRHLMWL